MYNWDAAVRVCACVRARACVCVKIHDGSLQKFLFAGALSLLLLFKGGANTFPESAVTWKMGSPFYSKWALISGHIHLHWAPQNVKCASMLEGYGICILCCRSHRHWIHPTTKSMPQGHAGYLRTSWPLGALKFNVSTELPICATSNLWSMWCSYKDAWAWLGNFKESTALLEIRSKFALGRNKKGKVFGIPT